MFRQRGPIRSPQEAVARTDLKRGTQYFYLNPVELEIAVDAVEILAMRLVSE